MAARTHHLAIDHAKTQAEEPQNGHNRWHEAIPPALEVDPGDIVVMETRDAFDGQLSPDSTDADVGKLVAAMAEVPRLMSIALRLE